MCTALFYYTCVYIYSLLNSCGYWTLNKYYYYYYYKYVELLIQLLRSSLSGQKYQGFQCKNLECFKDKVNGIVRYLDHNCIYNILPI